MKKYLLVYITLLGLLFHVVDGSSQQFFRKKPRDQKIIAGQSTTIPCEIGNRHGSVQWTRDGLTLGFDRKLPGFSRYSVSGKEINGQFNLEIVNATLNDDATFECQVGPADGNSPIRARAKLDVLLPPKRIEITGLDSGSRIIIRENEEVELKCVVFEAKPKATIIWYRENSKFFTESRIDEDTIGEDAEHRVTSISSIRIRPTQKDNHVTWACEAVHPALKNAPMRASVLLSVQHPPGRPEITGYIEGETIRVAQSVTLICTSRGGNPLADVIWYRNGELADKSYTSSGRESRNTFTFIAETDDDNARFRCEASNEFSAEPMDAEIVLSVQFAPSKIYLYGPNEARRDDSVDYSCSTSNSNPPAIIQWIIDNSTLDASSYFTQKLPSPMGGWITVSNISVKVEENKKNKIVSCHVLNSELNDVKTKSQILSVIYPPGTPTIQGLSFDDVLIAGKLKRLKCTSMAGNPPPTLRWYRGKELLHSRTVITDQFASAELEFIPARKDNLGDLRCEAINSALRFPVYASQNLSVDFSPNFVKIESHPEFPVSGEKSLLTCESGTSQPPSQITWWIGDEEIIDGVRSNDYPGEFGGKRSRSELQLLVSGRIHNGALIRCRAQNHLDYVDDTITLSVAHKPIFTVEDTTAPFEAIEGKEAIINMTALANPPVSTYKWSLNLNDEEQNRQGLTIQDGVLKINKASRSHAGIYAVSATNERGTSSITFEIDILYAPKIVYLTDSVLVGEGEPALFECAVDANPFNIQTIHWFRENYDMEGRTKTTQGSVVDKSGSGGEHVGTVMLTVLNATASDSGAFWCEADNGIERRGRIARNRTYLLVRHKPWVKQTPNNIKAAANPGEMGVLICEASGVPNVTISWVRSSSAFEDKEKYRIVHTMLDPLTWRSEFYIHDVGIKDYGTYECIARNTEGSARQKIVFDVKTKPDIPSKLRVDKILHESVHLMWVPGFNGGTDQHFRLQFSSQENGVEFRDVYPVNADNFVVNKLEPGVEYAFNIMAFNNQGESNYTDSSVIVHTSSGGSKQMITDALSEKAEGTMNIIIIVSVIISIVLLLIFIITCLCTRRRRRIKKSRGLGSDDNIVVREKRGGVGCTSSGSEGSSSVGSTKSGTMELYTSSYNETNSGAGETVSSISEKSCVSGNAVIPPPMLAQTTNFQPHTHYHNHHQMGYLEDGLIKNSRSTYFLDPPNTSRVGSLRRPPSQSNQPPIYCVVNKLHRTMQHGNMTQRDYEDTESEYASEIRSNPHIQTLGDQNTYGRSSGGGSGNNYSSVRRPARSHVNTLNNNHIDSQNTFQDRSICNQIRPPSIETSSNSEGPLCASSPKRTPLTSFGPQMETTSTTSSSNPSGVIPPMGQLV
ncbi:nephrin isoform X2 [Lepeophtheirus salmonis]|uniref:nephrin isoform X2 n=1 Tax=Lepeophtheirus salmonis TaxID=72036 RepID=UPI001AE7D254|nr:synaptogenesis protein syg-2-like isoform X2 [Lepeophtheirus salmonis]